MSTTSKTQPGIGKRFVDEVEARCTAMGLMPTVLCVMAGLSHATWANWSEEDHAPSSAAMDKVLSELERQEKLRAKR